MLARPTRSRFTRKLVDLAHDRLRGCESCWRDNAFEFADEALSKLKLNDLEYRRLFKGLRCPSCGTRIFPTTFVLSVTNEELRELGSEQHCRELERFRHALVRYPTLGLAHRVGRRFDGNLRRAKTSVLDSGRWYHAKPKVGRAGPGAGRFHQAGQTTWYMASDPKTAAIEALRQVAPDTVEILEEEIQQPLTVIDLRQLPCEEGQLGNWFVRNAVARGYVSEAREDQGQDAYRIPQFISDLARRRGVHGILHSSTRPPPNGSPMGGDCLALFDTKRVTNTRTLGGFHFSGPHADINFLEETWRLVPAEDADSPALSGSGFTVETRR
jgi:hypothetical protein